jgi:hypothetical protein
MLYCVFGILIPVLVSPVIIILLQQQKEPGDRHHFGLDKCDLLR